MPGARLALSAATRQDIRDALAFTLERFGKVKAQDYADLVRLALRELADNPRAGRARPDIHLAAFDYRIARPGRDARHLFLYEVVDGAARVYGFFYDGMDLPHRWQKREPR